MSNRVILTRAIPGAGKTVWAKDQQRQNPNLLRVNKDDIRAMVHDGKWSKKNEEFVLLVRNFIIETALTGGYDVVVDDMNGHPKHFNEIQSLAERYSAEVEVKEFDVPLEECLRRDNLRERKVGEKVITEMYNKFFRKPLPIAEINPSLLFCTLCDVDGTVALMNGRGPFEWTKVGTDLPNLPIVTLVKELSTYRNVVFVSGRDECCRKDTEEWLKIHFPSIRFIELYMRPEGDNRKDSIVKKELYEKYIKPNYNVSLWIDDRTQVVTMVRNELGLTCLQVAEGSF